MIFKDPMPHAYFVVLLCLITDEAGDEVFTLYEHNLAVHPLQCKA